MSEIEWPDEIWAAAHGEFEPRGEYVTSEFATVPRWEGDAEDFERYVHGNIFDSQERYFKSLREQDQEKIQSLEAAIAERDRLLDNLTITIGAIIVAAGGQVEVPQSVLEDIQSFELEKAPGSNGGVTYATRSRGQVEQ